MIFQKIRITNLFAYYGSAELDLRGAAPERNIVLIQGRNGFGKTSLLNSIKLLFTGVTDEMRQSVQRQRKPSIKQYVLGADEDWWGIMNRRAYEDGHRECSIAIEWQETQGHVKAQRHWWMDKSAYEFTETLTIEADFLDYKLEETGDEEVSEREATDFLQYRLPPEYVPFFFFDGEQIQELAEANRDQQREQMERLLNLSQLEFLNDRLSAAISSWRQEAMSESEQASLRSMQARLRELQAGYADQQQRQARTAEDIEKAEEDKQRLERRLRNLRAYVREQDEARLQERERHLEEELERVRGAISEILPSDAILLVNPALVARARGRLQAIADSESGSQSLLLEDLREGLPEDLFDRPAHSSPPLSASQKAFYKEKLEHLLNVRLPDLEGSGEGWRLDPVRAARARDLLAPYDAGETLRKGRTNDLKRVRQLTAELEKTRTELANISALSGEDKERFERYQQELGALEERLIDLKAQAQQVESKVKELGAQICDKENEIARQEENVRTAGKAREKVELARRMQGFLRDFKARKRVEKREALEEAMNQHFRALMTSHELVAHIEIGEEFEVRYRDADGSPVGMGSLSAGMKQLAATALIWALKEVAGSPMPVIVDTPLARIDRTNQDNLLRHYYPNASDQVIILPTDSEIDAEKAAVLKDHVYRQYALKNPDGEHAAFERIEPPATSAGEAAYA